MCSKLWLVSISLLLLIKVSEALVCPPLYNLIFNGCYKLNNGSKATWSEARQHCANDSTVNYETHLVALESAIETASLIYWMKAWSIESEFWIDGKVMSKSWDWSGQKIVWYFNSSDLAILGKGSNYKIVYNATKTTYQVIDEVNSKLSYFICESQVPCDPNNSCRNNATCYLNGGRELCICAPGYIGSICETQMLASGVTSSFRLSLIFFFLSFLLLLHVDLYE